jgi:hypothetical protein
VDRSVKAGALCPGSALFLHRAVRLESGSLPQKRARSTAIALTRSPLNHRLTEDSSPYPFAQSSTSNPHVFVNPANPVNPVKISPELPTSLTSTLGAGQDPLASLSPLNHRLTEDSSPYPAALHLLFPISDNQRLSAVKKSPQISVPSKKLHFLTIKLSPLAMEGLSVANRSTLKLKS